MTELPPGGRLVPREWGHTGAQCWSLLFLQRGLEEGNALLTGMYHPWGCELKRLPAISVNKGCRSHQATTL